MQWTEKYRPKALGEIAGQDDAVMKIKKFVHEFHLGKEGHAGKKAIMLHGSPGTGKTSLAYAAANDTNSEIFELNASDLRNRERLHGVLRPAVEQQSLSKRKKIILIDEVDGISGYYDKGGVQEILSLIDATTYPIIITANDAWGKKLSELRKRCEIIRMKSVNYKTVKDVLLRILENEKIFLNPDTIAEISIKARGDIRAAINDLQKEAHGSPGTKEVKIDERDKEKDIFNVLREIFKNKPSRESLELFDSLSMGIDEVMLWIEKNIPLEYRGKELEKAFDLLSRADVFRGRIYRQQYWRFLVYENFFLSYGISASKSKERFSGGFTSYKRPDRILKIWLNNRKTERKKSIAEKYARHAHIGKKRAESEFPIIAMFLKNPEIQRELGLDTGEIEYLNS